ncbi:MFS transporter [Alicyclobacillus fastidiosus]|uniref:MFS transporter n=1 Tax=Alicyclobacillus fastidiosus TaxID=392011 RepID=A0ABV5AJC1_9BACL|nr:MFS transporter [Alicyclobacillus fastidiosus]WEH09085.1 MFS transporter [Alicyclobacillus fastidiosus]
MKRIDKGKVSATILITSSGISNIGDCVYLVALNLYVLNTTNSAFLVALIWCVPLVAQLLIGGWIGSVTDRLPLRSTLITTEISRAIVVFLLPLVPIVWIYPLLFLLGWGSTIFNRSFLPYRTLLIPVEHQKFVNSLMNVFQSGALLLGPAIAGVLIQFGSMALALWVDALSFAISCISFVLLPALSHERVENEKLHNAQGIGVIWKKLRLDWLEATQFLKGHSLFASLFVATAASQVFGQAADSQEVVFAEKALHLGHFGYGMMVVAAGLGFLLGSLVLSLFANLFSTKFLLACGSVLGGIGYFIYALAQDFWQAVIGLIIMGVFVTAESVGFNTYTQHAVPVEKMGRINNLLDPPQKGFTLIMMVVASVVTEQYGVRILMLSVTCITIITGISNTILALLPRNRNSFETSV